MTHESKTALQKLGARLADLLDEDQWVECEELLIEAGALPPDIERLVDQFLAWKLPGDFSPDAGITFNPGHITRSSPLWPTGTNLLNSTQARKMFEYLFGANHYTERQRNRRRTSAASEASELTLMLDFYFYLE